MRRSLSGDRQAIQAIGHGRSISPTDVVQTRMACGAHMAPSLADLEKPYWCTKMAISKLRIWQAIPNTALASRHTLDQVRSNSAWFVSTPSPAPLSLSTIRRLVSSLMADVLLMRESSSVRSVERDKYCLGSNPTVWSFWFYPARLSRLP